MHLAFQVLLLQAQALLLQVF
uniref:Clustered mitochondria protein-like n=1 Tax=Rhizophora mucronata TaxID=61149 RepID=A0A2P2JKA6_RHIMU